MVDEQMYTQMHPTHVHRQTTHVVCMSDCKFAISEDMDVVKISPVIFFYFHMFTFFAAAAAALLLLSYLRSSTMGSDVYRYLLTDRVLCDGSIIYIAC